MRVFPSTASLASRLAILLAVALVVAAYLASAAQLASASHGDGAVYVDPSGDDSGAGSEADPLASLQAAVDHLVAEHGGVGTIEVADTLTGEVAIATIPAGADITIDGNCEPTPTIELDALGLGRVLRVEAGASLTLSCVTITGGEVGTGSEGGPIGAGILNDGVLTLNTAAVSGNTALGDGARGGGIYNTGSITFAGYLVANNQVSAASGTVEGGGVYNAGGSITHEGASTLTFEENAASILEGEARGGAIYNEGGSLDAQDFLTLSENSAIIRGGLTPGAGASGTGQGGAIYNDGGSVFIRDATVEDNYAGAEEGANGSGQGGAIYSDSSEGFTISGFAAFIQNFAGGDGNDAGGEGGALYLAGDGGVAVVVSALFEENWAQTAGGAIYQAPGTLELTVVWTSFFANTTESLGGAIRSEASGSGVLRVRGSVFGATDIANEAYESGTGHDVSVLNAASADLEWNYWHDGIAGDEIDGIDDPDGVCVDEFCWGELIVTLDMETQGSVLVEHAGPEVDPAFAHALAATNLAFQPEGYDFEDLIGASPLCDSTTADVDRCTYFSPLGLVVTLTATPEPSFGFAGWEDCGDDADTEVATLTIDDPDEVTCTAVFGEAPSIDTDALPDGIVDELYEASLVASGGASPYTWTIVEGSLPPDVELGENDGSLSGTPAAAGVFTFTVQVEDSIGVSTTRELSITIIAPLTIVTPSLPGGTEGDLYSLQFEATGGEPPYTWSVTGPLPPGVDLGATTGVLSGTPSAAGDYPITVTVTDDGGGVDSSDYMLTIDAAETPEGSPDPTPTSGPSVTPTPGDQDGGGDGDGNGDGDDDKPCGFVDAPSGRGVHIAVLAGDCTIEELPAATSYWVTSGGRLVGYIAGAPTWVNADFLALYGETGIPAGTGVIVVLP